MEVVQKHGGTVISGPFNADGTVGIVKDPFGAVFAIYDRTDPPGETKPGMAVL
jgi:hypothetical protein